VEALSLVLGNDRIEQGLDEGIPRWTVIDDGQQAVLDGRAPNSGSPSRAVPAENVIRRSG